jgi:hypothetical protein
MTRDRWQFVIGCVASSMIGAAMTHVLSGAPLAAQPAAAVQSFDTVRARRFELVNSDGRVYAVLGNLGYQGITSPLIGLAFLDSDNQPLLSLGLGPEHDPIMASWQVATGQRAGETLRRGTQIFRLFGNSLDVIAQNGRDGKGEPMVINPRVDVSGFNQHGVALTVLDGKGVVLTR